MRSQQQIFAIILLSIFNVNPTDGLAKLLNVSSASLVENARNGVVYLFQLARTSTVPNYAPLNLKTETWLKLSGINFHRLSDEFLLGGPNGTIPFALYNGQYYASSDAIIEEIGSEQGKYTTNGEEKRIRGIIDDVLFKIVVLDRVSTNNLTGVYGYDWTISDEGVIQQAMPAFVQNRNQNITLNGVPFQIQLNSTSWRAYFNAYNAEENTSKIAVLREYLIPNNGTGTIGEFKIGDWESFNSQLRSNLITPVLTRVFGAGGQLEAKLDAFLNLNNYTDGNQSGPYLRLKSDGPAILSLIERTMAPIYELLAASNGSFLFGQKPTAADASLFGAVVQLLEVPLANSALIDYFNGMNSLDVERLRQFVKAIKLAIGLDDNQWAMLSHKPWPLNYEQHKVEGKNSTKKYDGPFKVEVNSGLEEIFAGNATLDADSVENLPKEVQTAIRALVATNSSNIPEMLRIMAAYLCNLGSSTSDESGKECAKTHMANITNGVIIKKARQLTYNAIVAYNEDLVRQNVLAAYATANAIGANSPDALGNEL